MHSLENYGAKPRHFALAAQLPELYLARIVSQSQQLYRIATDAGECLAHVSGKLRYGAQERAQFPAVGDFVLVDRCTGESGDAVVKQILPRTSAFVRRGADDAHDVQIVAANIDVALCCMALNRDYNLSRLERYLSVAWSSGATPVVVLTKADLCPNLSAVQNEVAAAAPGTDVITTALGDSASRATLFDYLAPGITGTLLGSSGVGKTTLLNDLTGASLQTGPVRADGKGRHTTTRRELIVLPNGGIVIDTPGMRELGAESVDLSHSFAELDALAAQCRYRDCTHTSEPGCAVLAALASGALDARRLESYRKLKREARYEGLDARAREHEKCSAMFADVGGMKKVRKYIRQTDKRK